MPVYGVVDREPFQYIFGVGRSSVSTRKHGFGVDCELDEYDVVQATG